MNEASILSYLQRIPHLRNIEVSGQVYSPIALLLGQVLDRTVLLAELPVSAFRPKVVKWSGSWQGLQHRPYGNSTVTL